MLIKAGLKDKHIFMQEEILGIVRFSNVRCKLKDCIRADRAEPEPDSGH